MYLPQQDFGIGILVDLGVSSDRSDESTTSGEDGNNSLGIRGDGGMIPTPGS